MLTPIVFILLIALFVIVHETGHFLAAKRNGIGIEEFAFGFPPRLWSKKLKETIYSLNLIPLGGYVKLHGEDKARDSKSYAAKSVWSRFKVVTAGVLMNLFLGYILLVVYFSLGGSPLVADASKYSSWLKYSEKYPLVINVTDNSLGSKLGIKSGDVILEINGQKISSAQEFSAFTARNPNKEFVMKIKRENEEIGFQGLIPEVDGRGMIGLEITDFYSKIKLHFWAVPLMAAVDFYSILVLIFYFFGNLILSLFHKAKPLGGVVGPVGVYVVTKEAISLGFLYVLRLAILLTINLAIINFIPFPALDGGKALFLAVEKIRRKPTTPEIENLIHLIGFFILILLIVALTVKDVLKLI